MRFNCVTLTHGRFADRMVRTHDYLRGTVRFAFIIHAQRCLSSKSAVISIEARNLAFATVAWAAFVKKGPRRQHMPPTGHPVVVATRSYHVGRGSPSL